MKLKSKYKKIIVISLLVMIIGSAFIGNFNNIYGKINSVYQTSGEVGSIDVDNAVSNSTVLDAIARMFYAIAGFIENIVGSIVKIITGSKMFPWADRVIFNTMPLLDINFLTSSNGSMFKDSSGNPTSMGSIVQNMYYTLFTIAVAFFGVVVGVMALRLAISSIASEKAKYKQAITNWLLALILLFTAHYLMSFVFFINEKMVEVASSILTTYGDEVSFDINVDGMTSEERNEFIEALIEYADVSSFNGDATINTNYEDKWSLIFCETDETYDLGVMSKSFDKLPSNQKVFSIVWKKPYSNAVASHLEKTDYKIHEFDNKSDWENKADNNMDTGALHDQWTTIICELYADSAYKATIDLEDWEEVSAVATDAAYILLLEKYHEDVFKNETKFKTGIKNIGNYINSFTASDKYDFGDEDDLKIHIDKLWEFVDIKYNNGNSGNYKGEVFTGMADFFKSSVTSVSTFENEDGDTEVKDFNAIPAILFSIFVLQSIMYFIAYLKRFFYIIILALFAPLVIIYDFLMKSAS